MAFDTKMCEGLMKHPLETRPYPLTRDVAAFFVLTSGRHMATVIAGGRGTAPDPRLP